MFPSSGGYTKRINIISSLIVFSCLYDYIPNKSVIIFMTHQEDPSHHFCYFIVTIYWVHEIEIVA